MFLAFIWGIQAAFINASVLHPASHCTSLGQSPSKQISVCSYRSPSWSGNCLCSPTMRPRLFPCFQDSLRFYCHFHSIHLPFIGYFKQFIKPMDSVDFSPVVPGWDLGYTFFPGQTGTLKTALLDYIKRCRPGDSEKHNMIALCFSMCREIGENHEAAACIQLKLIESQPWGECSPGGRRWHFSSEKHLNLRTEKAKVSSTKSTLELHFIRAYISHQSSPEWTHLLVNIPRLFFPSSLPSLSGSEPLSFLYNCPLLYRRKPQGWRPTKTAPA